MWGYGENWNEVRRFTKKTLKEFGYGKVQITHESLADSANQLVDSIKMDLMDSVNGTYFVESQKFGIHVLNVLWNSVGGYKFDPNDKRLNGNMKCANKIVDIASHTNPYNLFPFLKTWFPNQVKHPEHVKIFGEIHDFTEVII